MFASSHPFAFFDYFRVPYTVQPTLTGGPQAGIPIPVRHLRMAEQPGDSRRSLLWLGSDAWRAASSASGRLGRYELRDFTFFGHVALGSAAPGALSRFGDGWQPVEQIRDEEGHWRAAVWRDAAGSIFLPFDPGELMETFWSESYRRVGRSRLAASSRAALVRGYYFARPAMPRQLQLRLRRAFTRVQAKSSFPNWPIEGSLHAMYAWMFGLIAEMTGRQVPFIDPWPHGRSWALVLTHDVETSLGCRDFALLRDPEREFGYRSSWNFVPLRYRVSDEMVHALYEDGCEVGVHGLRHDGRDLGSRRLLAKRLPEIRQYADRWKAVGFRSPATQRQWDFMPQLGFDYDSSYTDTDPYEPQPGGCCTYLPYFNDSTVELPITLPQDHTLFSILQNPDAEMWISKAKSLRERRAMALVLTHPDYAVDPRVAEGYRTLLKCFRDDDTVWHALPREVAAWWRQRACSSLRREGDGWRIDGPASSAGRISYATTSGIRTRASL